MEKLLVATTNKGKIREIKGYLEGLPFQIISLDDLPIAPPPVEETGETFEENAILKSEYYFAQTGLLSLADDSGLAVDALNGEPGVYSARFAGENATDADRVKKLLNAMNDVPNEERSAQFVCSIALTGKINGKYETRIFEADARGWITREPRGTYGFGFDPVFEDPDLKMTFAEVSQEEKGKRSHRGKALTATRKFLEAISKK